LYKTPGEREAEARRDPLRRMQQFLKTEGLATDQDLADIAASVDREVNQAAEEALRAPKPDPATAADFVFSPDIDPTSTSSPPNPATGQADTMVAAINATLKDEMARNPRIVIFGQDVADASNSEALSLVTARAACSR
jgi:2-oxoisovalerate dehydrogenase E1 component